MTVLYGELATVEINSRPGRGTKVTLQMPILESGAETWGQAGKEALGLAGQLLDNAVRSMRGRGQT